jgi:tetratricopeptide (TPR) repeat protein
VHQTPAGPLPVPRQVPVPPAQFVNRTAELAALDGLVAGGARVVVLTGPGGVGKTSLAAVWAYRMRDGFPDGQLYADLGGDRPKDPGEVLGGFLRALGVAGARIPVGLAEQSALFRSATADRAVLVLLDNAFSAGQVHVLLPGSVASVAVVTSRSRLLGLVPDGARLVEVAPLDAAESVRLLARTVGAERVAAEREHAERLAELCAGLPVALTVAAARLAARPLLRIGKVVAQLVDETHRLAGVQATFDLSYRSLDPLSALLYRRLALHPGVEFGLGPAVALGADPGAVEALLEANLLQEVGEERFRYHDLLRLHAKQKAEAEDGPEVRRGAVRAMAEWYLAAAGCADRVVTPYRRRLAYQWTTEPGDLPDFSDRAGALAWLELEGDNVIAAGRAAVAHGYPELAWQLCDVLWPMFLYFKRYRDRLDVDARGVAAAQAWGNGWAEADMRKRLGRVCTVVRDYGAAETHIRQAIELYTEAGDVRGSIDARETLAALYRDTGRVEEAADLWRQALAANRERGEDRNTGLTLISLGLLLPELGRAEEAVDLLREAGRVFARLSDIDPYNEVRVLTGLAGAWLRLGDLAAAEEAATGAVRRMAALGSAYERAEALDVLGRIAHQRGDRAVAADHYRDALAVFEELGSARAETVRGRLAEVSG